MPGLLRGHDRTGQDCDRTVHKEPADNERVVHFILGKAGKRKQVKDGMNNKDSKPE